MGDDYGPWEPATVGRIAELFSGAPFRWWVSGGVALELHVGRSWRPHSDADVGICRLDAPAVHRWLAGHRPGGLRPYVAAGGRLRPWDGRALSAGADENNVWIRRSADGPWVLDLAVGDGDARGWVYRRDPSVRRPWPEVVLCTAGGVPYLAPEVQLLFKSKGLRGKDHEDARTVIPLLEPDRRRWLSETLPAGHPWRALVAGTLRS